jgi:alkylation response protein AidB-like acyl-CoA dehydrogenase
MVAGAAVQKLMMKIDSEQEILMNIADMAIDTYNAESALLRVIKMTETKGEENCRMQYDMVKVYLTDAAARVNKNGADAINGFAEGDEQRMMLLGLKRFTKAEAYNTKDARRRIADKLIGDGKYPL